jgi:CheY-like chemotaxis protein
MDKIKYFGLMMKLTYLKPHIIFLGKKIIVLPYNNGRDAIDLFENANFDVVFLDENMPE